MNVFFLFTLILWIVVKCLKGFYFRSLFLNLQKGDVIVTNYSLCCIHVLLLPQEIHNIYHVICNVVCMYVFIHLFIVILIIVVK